MKKALMATALLSLSFSAYAVHDSITNNTNEDVVITQKVAYGVKSYFPGSQITIKPHQTKSWDFTITDFDELFYELLFSIDGPDGIGLIEIDFTSGHSGGIAIVDHPYSNYDTHVTNDDERCWSDRLSVLNQCHIDESIDYYKPDNAGSEQ